jgi:hypothetical protein
MEIAGADGSLRDLEWRDFLGFDVNDPILILDWSGDLKKPAAGHNRALCGNEAICARLST